MGLGAGNGDGSLCLEPLVKWDVHELKSTDCNCCCLQVCVLVPEKYTARDIFILPVFWEKQQRVGPHFALGILQVLPPHEFWLLVLSPN